MSRIFCSFWTKLESKSLGWQDGKGWKRAPSPGISTCESSGVRLFALQSRIYMARCFPRVQWGRARITLLLLCKTKQVYLLLI